MIHPIRSWNRAFFSVISARPLGMIRICYGLLALANLGFCAVDIDYWYSDAGLLQGSESKVMAGYLLFSPLHYLQTPLAARVAFGFTALAAVGLTVGWRTKLMSILFWGGMLSIHNRNIVSSSGADVLLLVFAFNLMLSPCGAAYSIDRWLADRKRGTKAEPLILAWSVRLIQFQIGLVYALAAILKCGGSLWLNGSALHYVLNNAEVRRLDLSYLSQFPILINLMTYTALVFEFSLAFLLWFRATRPMAICCGIMLHLGILATVNIPIFGELMWIGYLAFLTPPEFAALTRTLDARRWFGRRQMATSAESALPVAVPVAALTAGPLVVADDESDSAFDFAFKADAEFDAEPEPAAFTGLIAGRPAMIRVDGPAAAILTPHAEQPAPKSRTESENKFAEAALDPWDSFQILM